MAGGKGERGPAVGRVWPTGQRSRISSPALLLHWFALKSPSKSKAKQWLKKVQPAKGLSSIKTQKVLNISEDKKGAGNQAHHRWTECIK